MYIPLSEPLSLIYRLVGYVAGKNLFSAPYDWRFGPDAFGPQYDALKQLIETASALNNNKPVVLVSLSLGGPYTHLFLTSHVSQVNIDVITDDMLDILTTLFDSRGKINISVALFLTRESLQDLLYRCTLFSGKVS